MNTNQSNKKPLLKQWWFWVLGVAVLAIVANATSGSKSTQGSRHAKTVVFQGALPAVRSAFLAESIPVCKVKQVDEHHLAIENRCPGTDKSSEYDGEVMLDDSKGMTAVTIVNNLRDSAQAEATNTAWVTLVSKRLGTPVVE